jgi:L-alanine-DL-glutamate epimerase-like enolase superfamily enzyme
MHGETTRREFLAATCGMAAAAVAGGGQAPATRIRRVTIGKRVTIEVENGTRGTFSAGPFPKVIHAHGKRIQELLQGKDPFRPDLGGPMLWEAIYPGKARLYAEGRDPLTGAVIANKPRGGRHTETGKLFVGFGAVDIALWDLRARLLGKPAYQVIGTANRKRVPVYWRPGEPKQGLDDARRRAREAFDRGYRYQKWYFMYSAKDGERGLRENIELVRVLREELGPAGKLMIDNHGLRYGDDVAYSVKLCKAVKPYEPYFIEEPICPEHVDGYARIKGETGITIAGGEHLYTRWPVKAFLERRCLDFVQSDPFWCGGISEWLKIVELVAAHPGVKVLPHITAPWIHVPHCVASQPAALCPLLEFNYEGGRRSLEGRMRRSAAGDMLMTLPETPGIS